jgi:methionyl-tRNA formyltransferase
MHNGVRLKLLDAELVEKNGPIGTIIDESGVVACGSNAIRILSIQRPGKAEQDWKSFTRGYEINHADTLS